MLAKSSGVQLDLHSKLVSRFAVRIAKLSLLEPLDNIIQAVQIAGLLHDIGKCTEVFQKKLNSAIKAKTGDEMIEEGDKKYKYRHNEVGWAFLVEHLTVKQEIKDLVLDAVYWHHGISNKMSEYNASDVNLSNKDINTMTNFANSVISGVIGVCPYEPVAAPKYYENFNIDKTGQINTTRTFVRTCIISADRMVSSFDENNLINLTDEEIDKMIITTRESGINVINHPFYGSERFDLQEKIAAEEFKTAVIKAPAGFGKTLLGLLWSYRSNNKLIWVCPRNIVAESVYNSIIHELKQFKADNVSVELFYTNEVKMSTHCGKNPFTSDIVVTNIDSFLAPSVDNRAAARLHTIINADVVFDEHHELIGDTALTACFVNLMRVRTNLTKSKTVLLSATPTNIHILWDTIGQKTTILPSETSHYPAPHNKLYNLKTTNEIVVDDTTTNNLLILNSVFNAQKYRYETKAELLIHSKFLDEDRKRILSQIFEHYGKNSARVLNKPMVVGTHVIQASLDISFLNLIESVLSPEATLQRVGRVDRFGDYLETATITIARLTSISEAKVREVLYSNNLTHTWFDYISQFNGQQLTLNELYIHYNNFNTENSRTLTRLIMDKHAASQDCLSKIYPHKFFKSKKSDVKTAGGNKLRSSANEVFYICERYKTNLVFTTPISTQLYKYFDGDFKESDYTHNTEHEMKKMMKHFRDADIKYLNYTDMLAEKNLRLDDIRKAAKKSDTPYIVFDRVYHDEYGVIAKSKLSELSL